MKLYHFYRPPEKIVGTKLVPLSTLQQFASELAEQHASKYRNRDWFRERGGVAKIRIPYLSCTLADVVQLLAVPPALIQERQKLLGGPPLRFFEIESDSLDTNCLCVYYRNDEKTGEPIYEPFDSSLPLDKVEEDFEKWFREEIARGNPRRILVGVPHIYYKGEIDISGCPVVS
ncbi:hypothetical protein H8E77_35015 [bacterium]|nr:hypothetical protein [bacterium]